MKRGVVMSIHKKHAVVLTSDGQFVRAPIQEVPQIGEEIAFEEERPRRPRLYKAAYWSTGAAAVICLLLIAYLFIPFRDADVVVAYLSVDINPSVEIGVDGREKVRELRALNEDGEKIVDGIEYWGVPIEYVAASIFDSARNFHYFDNPDKAVIITSTLLHSDSRRYLEYESLLTQKLDAKLSEILARNEAEAKNVNVTTLSVPEGLRTEANANGISSGKMAVYLMAKSEGYELQLDQMKQESIDSITEPIGGVTSIVANADQGSKEKLQQLLEQEQKEKEKQKAKEHAESDKKKENEKAKEAAKKKAEEKANDKANVKTKDKENKKVREKNEYKEKWKEKRKERQKERQLERQKTKEKEKQNKENIVKENNNKAGKDNKNKESNKENGKGKVKEKGNEKEKQQNKQTEKQKNKTNSKDSTASKVKSKDNKGRDSTKDHKTNKPMNGGK